MTSENETRTVSGTIEGPSEAQCASDLQVCAPPGTRTPNPLIKRSLHCSSRPPATASGSGALGAFCRRLLGVVGVRIGVMRLPLDGQRGEGGEGGDRASGFALTHGKGLQL
jgi:hypothetical protein